MLSVTFDRDIENRLEALGATDQGSKIALVQDRLRAALWKSARRLPLSFEKGRGEN